MHRPPLSLIPAFGLTLLLAGCDRAADTADTASGYAYERATQGTRRFQWDTETGPGHIKVLLEEQNLGSPDTEIAEIYFPPDYQGATHPHEFEIIYVLEGRLDHIVNGESHILEAGMIGVVREPDLVVHRTDSARGARTLVIWPLGNEVAGFEESTMQELPLADN